MNTPQNPYTKSAMPAQPMPRKILNATQAFFKMEAAGGIMLVIFALIALFLANTPLYEYYDYILHSVKFRIGFNDIDSTFDFEIRKSLLHWINDGLMAIFFFLVGLEIKREFVTGELSSRSRALLPFIAAIGGMILPAVIYMFINIDIQENYSGWAIPAATDIAFALGVLALLGSRAPFRLKVLLTAIAVIDDLGAIIIIALFYTSNLYLPSLIIAAICLVGLFILNRRGVSGRAPYVLIGLILWVAVLQSGVHATLAGVATALFIPMTCPRREGYSPVEHLEHSLHPWVTFLILPLFAFANAGVPFAGMTLHAFMDELTLGIILGLVVGKQVGIFGFLWLTIKSGLCPMPSNTTWLQLYGVSILCGIGFTMSLFIGNLAFDELWQQAEIRLGVLTGSTISAIMGFAILYFAPAKIEGEKTV